MSDREEICELMSRYCWHVDHSEWDAWLNLFTLDASWGVKGAPPFVGREAMGKLAEHLAQLMMQSPGRHVIACEIVDIRGDQARLRCYLLLFACGSARTRTIGEYDISLTKVDQRWTIHTLEFVRLNDEAVASA
jgi:3-phenylpropionate/cinnamic acid dioxygenase small subunit